MEKEKKTKGTALKTFISFINGNKFIILMAIVTMFIAILLSYVTPQIIRFTVNNLLDNEPVPDYLVGAVEFLGGIGYLKNNVYIVGLILLGVSTVQAGFFFIRRLLTLQASERVGKNIKDRMYGHIQTLPFKWHSSIKTGDIIQRSTQDSDLIKRYVSNQLIELIRIVIMMALGLVLMFYMNLQLTLIALGFILATLLFSVIYFPLVAKNFKITDEEEGKFTAMLQENLTGLRVVRAFGTQAYEKQKYEKKNNEYVSIWIKFAKKLGAFWGSGDIIAGLQTAVIIIVGALMAIDEKIPVGDLIAFIAYNQMLIWPVRSLGRIVAETGKVKASVMRLEEVLNASPEPEGEGESEAEIKGGIEFKDVTFSYNGNRKILENVNFEIKKGQVFGIIGGMGSGKSTIAQLISRLYEVDEGQILIDGTDIKKIKRGHLRRHIGLILQEPFMFSRKLSENIGITMDKIDIDDLNKYIKIASLDSSIEEFKEGLDTVVGEKGVTLSGGQKQRAVIARTLIQKPEVVIFDDSLSAVDTETDSKIRAALKENLKDTTVIIISHRITSLMHADNIMVLNNGKVESIGVHGELIKREGTYKRLYELQTSVL